MGNYKVVSITDREGNPRTDGRYPLRIGRICQKPDVMPGALMIINWLQQPDGTPYVGWMETSMVIGFTDIKGILTVTTRNSIYTFERL